MSCSAIEVLTCDSVVLGPLGAGGAVASCSINVPMLDAVGHPHAVNPDKDLRKVAAGRGWPVLVFTRPVALRSRLRLPPARVTLPPLMRGYLLLGAEICGDPAHDPDFGVGDFPALLDNREADVRYLQRLRSVSQAGEMSDGTGR